MRRFMTPIFAAGLLAIAAGCSKNGPETSQAPETSPPASVQDQVPSAPAPPPGGGLAGTVTETMDAAGYTYVQVDTGDGTIWAAAPQFPVEVGEKVTVPEGMPMPNYHSATLDRDFDVVYFVAAVIKGEGDPQSPAGAGMPLPEGMHPSVDPSKGAVQPSVSFEGIIAPEGGTTVGEVWTSRESLAGKKVLVRGKVVKFNSQVMGKNWIHLQDGTGDDGMNDLTVTTLGSASVGDTVLVDGTVTLNKDFGFGYKYDIIVEDAEVTVE